MTTLDSIPSRDCCTTTRAVVVIAAVATAVAINLLIYAVGRLAGGDFSFTQDQATAQVDALTVAGFSAVPLGLGLTLVALLVRRIPRIASIAMVIAPVIAIATIAIMTIPVDLDAVSTLTLATCHLTLAPISVIAVRRLRH